MAQRDERRLEGNHLARPEAHEPATDGITPDGGGSGLADDVDRIRRVLHAKGDTRAGVGSHVGGYGTGWTLGRQHQMKAERSPTLGDRDEGVKEVGYLGGEGGELVDDHNKSCEGTSQVVPADGVLLEAGDTGVPKLPLSVANLSIEAAKSSGGQVPIEIGDDTDDVRKVGALSERTSAFEVHEHEVHVLGIDRQRQPKDQCAQELALP